MDEEFYETPSELRPEQSVTTNHRSLDSKDEQSCWHVYQENPDWRNRDHYGKLS